MDTNYQMIEQKNLAATESLIFAADKRRRFSAARILLFAAGLSVILWAGLSENFRSAENVLSARFCLPLAFGLGLIATGGLINTRLRVFGFWLSLALAGQAASLQMIDAGRFIHFQHYRSADELLDRDVFLLVALMLQTVFVAIGIGRRRTAIINWLGENFKLRQLIAIVAFLILAGAAVTRDAAIYATSVLFGAVVQVVNLANVVLIAASIPRAALVWLRAKIEAVFAANRTKDTRLDKFSIVAALWVVVLAGALSYFVYQAHPSVPDEVQYLFQAKYFAAGQFAVKAPLVPEAFAMYMIPRDEPQWFAIFPPGWAALLAVGVKINLVWLVNPLLGGLCILLSYLVLQEIYGLRTARIAVLLLCASPWFIFMAMSLMSHLLTLACALAAAVFLQRAVKRGKTIYVFAGGLAIGALSLIRPLDALVVAAAAGFFLLFALEDRRKRIANLAALAAGTVFAGVFVFPYNRLVTGSAWLFPLDAYYTKYFWSGANSLGFGANRGMNWGLDAFPGHSPLEAVVNAALNIFLLNTELFGWSAGSLILALAFVFSGKASKKDFWAFGMIGMIVFAYSLFWYHGGPDFGARYWFLAIVPLVALTARAIERLGAKTAQNAASPLNPRVAAAAAVLCVLSLLNYFPWRALDKYFHYLGMQPGIEKLAEEHRFGKSLVLVRGEEHPDYQSAWISNPLNFEGDAPLYAHDKSPEIRARLLEAYGDRPVWIVAGPTLTGGGYKIVAGPLGGNELNSQTNR